MGEAAAEKDFYWKLFKSTFIISAFTIGGGFVIIPLLKAKFVDEYKWMDDKEALNLVAIAQSAPGVVAANAAISMGYKLGGIRGTLTALLATILPPSISTNTPGTSILTRQRQIIIQQLRKLFFKMFL